MQFFRHKPTMRTYEYLYCRILILTRLKLRTKNLNLAGRPLRCSYLNIIDSAYHEYVNFYDILRWSLEYKVKKLNNNFYNIQFNNRVFNNNVLSVDISLYNSVIRKLKWLQFDTRNALKKS